MKHTLIVLAALLLGGCALMPQQPASVTRAGGAVAGATDLWRRLPGDYDNNAQVWQARQAGAALVPQHVRHHIEALAEPADSWRWDVTMDRDDGAALHATWRYALRVLDDGRRMLTPQRKLPAADDGEAQWAPLAPCALVGGVKDGVLVLSADTAACSAMLPGLGAAAAMLPTRVRFDGRTLDVTTFADHARGAEASERAQRVRWFDGWAAINGGGPQARADSTDWHVHHDLHVGDQGGAVSILWRDGKPSGYSLRLEQLDYRARGIEVLKLSVVRDSDGTTVAYAWANPEATRIGLNLGWLQAGLGLAGTDSASKH
ncbi:MAG TPA: hypothetical protein VFG73_11795 [Rhodanobacteraceae bacterium]|nr:hypothetical protein [Rhodanobacteraceae bacterium]